MLETDTYSPKYKHLLEDKMYFCRVLEWALTQHREKKTAPNNSFRLFVSLYYIGELNIHLLLFLDLGL